MGCYVEFEDLRFNFIKNKHKQKLLLKILTDLNLLDFNQLEIILDVPIQQIKEVRQGLAFFCTERAEKLGKLFLLMVSH